MGEQETIYRPERTGDLEVTISPPSPRYFSAQPSGRPPSPRRFVVICQQCVDFSINKCILKVPQTKTSTPTLLTLTLKVAVRKMSEVLFECNS